VLFWQAARAIVAKMQKSVWPRIRDWNSSRCDDLIEKLPSVMDESFDE
jgi:hypothetical protein